MKRTLFLASSQVVHRLSLTLPHRATRRASTHSSLCLDIKIVRLSLFSYSLSFFLLTSIVSSFLRKFALFFYQLSSIALSRSCIRCLVVRLRINHESLTLNYLRVLVFVLFRLDHVRSWLKANNKGVIFLFVVSCLRNVVVA